MYIQLYEKLVIIQKAYENIQTLGEQLYENLENKNVNEKMEKIQKNLIELEENVKMLLLKNQYYLNVLLKTTESIVDSVSEYNLERNNNSQIFMNELL